MRRRLTQAVERCKDSWINVGLVKLVFAIVVEEVGERRIEKGVVHRLAKGTADEPRRAIADIGGDHLPGAAACGQSGAASR